jgi:hydrogenase maturation factor
LGNREPILPAGKLPAALLERLLTRRQTDDPRVIIGPRVGTDAAAIDMGDRVLVVKTDPITFPAGDPGWYLVHVNANDIACMGADPKWLLVTALLPERNTTPSLVTDIFESLEKAASGIGVSLVGGHTEITIGLDRPILIGCMLGETTRDRLIDTHSAKPGDAILLCKGIAIEGTSLLAREGSDKRLSDLDTEVLHRAAGFLTDPGISVVQAARTLASSGALVRGMHDPTEGGLASALRELAASAGLAAEIDPDAIPIYPETAAICARLGLDPMGLISSGALLAVVDPQHVGFATQALEAAGISCVRIGSFTSDEGSDVFFKTEDGLMPLPEFAVDEIARYFTERG